MFDIDAEFTQYVETALWSSTDNADDSGGEPLDVNYDVDDIDPEALTRMRAELEEFVNTESIQLGLTYWVEHLGVGQIGHDFWLTRNGHGAGFWDRFGAGTEGYHIGQDLTVAAKAEGTSDLYVGDDGKVYVG